MSIMKTVEKSVNGYHNGHTQALADLHRSARAAEAAHDWQVAALKYQEILQLDADSEFAHTGLAQVRRRLAEVAVEANDIFEIDDAMIYRMRLYNYVRTAVNRAVKRAEKRISGI